MLRTLLMLLALGTLLLIGSANVGAQQTRPGGRTSASARAKATPARTRSKLTPGMPVPATAKRSSANAPATITPTTDANNNNSDTPNTVNANGSIGSQEKADSKGQGAYAAPGMSVTVPSSKNASYDGAAPRSQRPGNTLKSGARKQ